jgi:hypothetical protein
VARNFQVFEPLKFLAEVTQHIPEKGQHQILYFGSESQTPVWDSQAARHAEEENECKG